MRFLARTTVAALCVALLLLPATALGATRKPRPRTVVVRTLTGQVVGSPLPAGTRTAVPVLLDGASVRRSRLRQLVLVKVPRTALVRVPGNQRVALFTLRPGDVFRASVSIPAAARRAAYPALNAGVFSITRRATTLSAAELQERLAGLTGYVNALTGYVVAQFADLRGQVFALRGDLGRLQGGLDALRAQVAALPTGVSSEVTNLVTRVTQLESQIQTLTTQLSTLTTQLGTLTSDVSALQAKLAGIDPGDLAQALSDVATLQALVGGVNVGTLSTSVSTLSSQLTTLGAAVTAGDANLQSQVTSLSSSLTTVQGQLTTAQGQLSFLCSSGLLKGPVLSPSLLSSCPA